MEKSGFVYIWRDRKHKRYYIGSHWGTVDDGYVCSSSWMKQAYKRRPHDFSRRILSKNLKSRDAQYTEEQRWLKMIKHEEIRVRYYNLSLISNNGWHIPTEETKVKMRKKIMSPEARAKISAANLGKKLSEETKAKLSTIAKNRIFDIERSRSFVFSRKNKPGNINFRHTEESKAKMSARKKGHTSHWKGKRGQQTSMYGKRHSEETREKMRQAALRRKLNVSS